MSENNSIFDILEAVEQAVDAKVNRELLDAAVAAGDETAYNLIKLLNEFGIVGLNVHKFITKLQMVIELSDGLKGGKKDVQ